MSENQKWIAEDVPAHLVEPWHDEPWRDEDRDLSAPKLLGEFDSKEEAVGALIAECDWWVRKYGPILDNSHRRREHDLISGAVAMFMSGSTAVKVRERYYRVRPAGTPANWRQKTRQEAALVARAEVLEEVRRAIKDDHRRVRAGQRLGLSGGSWWAAYEVVTEMLRG